VPSCRRARCTWAIDALAIGCARKNRKPADRLGRGALDLATRQLRRKRRHPVLQLRELVGDVERQQVAPRGEHLAELDEDRAERLERLAQRCPRVAAASRPLPWTSTARSACSSPRASATRSSGFRVMVRLGSALPAFTVPPSSTAKRSAGSGGRAQLEGLAGERDEALARPRLGAEQPVQQKRKSHRGGGFLGQQAGPQCIC
jgi:hypothetical protein